MIPLTCGTFLWFRFQSETRVTLCFPFDPLGARRGLPGVTSVDLRRPYKKWVLGLSGIREEDPGETDPYRLKRGYVRTSKNPSGISDPTVFQWVKGANGLREVVSVQVPLRLRVGNLHRYVEETGKAWIEFGHPPEEEGNGVGRRVLSLST